MNAGFVLTIVCASYIEIPVERLKRVKMKDPFLIKPIVVKIKNIIGHFMANKKGNFQRFLFEPSQADPSREG